MNLISQQAAFNHSDQSQHNILMDSQSTASPIPRLTEKSSVQFLLAEFMEGKGICHCDQRPAARDMLSNLPDALITQMLSYLPTKEAVRTSVLSNRWKSLWLFVSGLDLDSRQFPDYNAFVGFVDRFLDFSREQKSCLHNLKLSIHKDDNDQFCVTRWIDFVATRKLKRLDVEFGPVYREYLEVIPLSLFICETLLYLRLHRVVLRKFESVSLPRLKTMLLEHNVYANEVVMESLISSCPVLEDLSIVRCVYDNVMVVRVHSQTLTSLSLEFDNDVDEDEDEEDDNFDQENLAVSIDAPRLEHLNFEDEISPSITISNSDSLTTVHIFGDFDLWSIHEHADLQKRHMISKFLTSISGVRELNISSDAFQIFSSWLKVEPLPQFCNLSRLEVALYYSLERLRTFLESCPNLKSLILTLLYYSPLKEQIVVSSVPQCLLSSLESVEITNINSKDPAEIDLVTRYFVENSGILKKLVLRCKSSTIEEDPVFLGKLLALPRRSSECQIEYVAERLVL